MVVDSLKYLGLFLKAFGYYLYDTEDKDQNVISWSHIQMPDYFNT